MVKIKMKNFDSTGIKTNISRRYKGEWPKFGLKLYKSSVTHCFDIVRRYAYPASRLFGNNHGNHRKARYTKCQWYARWSSDNSTVKYLI